MEASWDLVVPATAVLLSLVVLAVTCLHCRHKRPLVSIRQEHTSQSSEFRVIHPSQPVFCQSSAQPLSSRQLFPSSPLSEAGSLGRHRSFVAAEAGSSPSYENSADGSGTANDGSDLEDPGYIMVLPDGEAPSANHSRPSTPSSDLLHNYENLPEKPEEQEYLNVDPPKSEASSSSSGSTTKLSAPSDSNEEDEDEDEGNYVNVHDGMQMD